MGVGLAAGALADWRRATRIRRLKSQNMFLNVLKEPTNVLKEPNLVDAVTQL